MRCSKFLLGLFAALMISTSISAQGADLKGELEYGPYTPGFRFIENRDNTRLYPSSDAQEVEARPVRIYLWYPVSKSSKRPLLLETFVRLAAEDFGLVTEKFQAEGIPKVLTVQLAKGMSAEDLRELLESKTSSVEQAEPLKGPFPLLVLGQGLYYESPLSQLILCEFLASYGYVVATCPLLGTHYRLVNLNVEDLETQIRDLEFVIAYARTLPFVHAGRLGVIGYDLGGMAGLILSMRNPDVDAFLSLDAGILFPHGSGLPNNHPSYREGRFTVPWMHQTQGRFIKFLRDEKKLTSLLDRKAYGDSYLVAVPTTNHGIFSSYAMFGIRNAVPGYWDEVEPEQRAVHEAICRTALTFFDGYLNEDGEALESLHLMAQGQPGAGEKLKIEWKKGQKPPPAQAGLVHLIIEKGFGEVQPLIEQTRAAYPAETIFDESVLNWLGYHFLYWWGREREAVEVFKLNVSLFPDSANAYDSLGEAYLVMDEDELAIQSYRRSLELNPENKRASAILEKLMKKK